MMLRRANGPKNRGTGRNESRSASAGASEKPPPLREPLRNGHPLPSRLTRSLRSLAHPPSERSSDEPALASLVQTPHERARFYTAARPPRAVRIPHALGCSVLHAPKREA